MPEYNVSKLKLPNGDILNLPGGSAATYYGTCNSAATAQIKSVVVSEDQNFSLRKGVLIGVFFYNTNLYSSTVLNPIQLNVNSTGAKSIKYGEDSAGATTGTEPNAYGYENRIAYYMYDGTNWVWVSQGKDTLINLTSTASSTNETEAITPKGVYNTINNNTMSQSEAETGTSTTARTISAATLKAAIEEHSGTATEWLSETTVSSGSTETNGIEYTISTTNYKDGTTDTTYNNTFTVKNGTSSRPGVVYLTSTSADSSSASGTGDKTAATPLCVYNSIHDTDNALTLQNIGTGTDDTIAYTITASRLVYAVQAHDHLVDFKPAYTNPLVYDNTNKKLTLNADMDYYYRDSTGHPGGTDLDIESTGYLEIPYGNGTNPGLLKLSSAAATSSSASGNSDYTAATPKAVYDSIHSTSNVMSSAIATDGTDTTTGYTLTAARLKEAIETFGGTTYDAASTSDYGVTKLITTAATSSASSSLAATPKCVYNSIRSSSNAATTSDYGVILLSNSYTSTESSYKLYAATAYAVGKVNEKVDDKMDKPTFISSLLFTSRISSYQYAFSVFNGIAVLNFTATVGTAISSGSSTTILTSSGYIPASYRPSYAVGFLASVYDGDSKWDFVTAYVSTNGAIYVRPTTTIAVGDTIRGSISWTYSSSAWETG